jgi:hypothetical protein
MNKKLGLVGVLGIRGAPGGFEGERTARRAMSGYGAVLHVVDGRCVANAE